jgi:L-ascorbate metabolism protein UlaG (beta-lactamase superfamily)
MRGRHTPQSVIEPASLPRIDIALVSHDQHEDNLDPAGSAFLSQVGRVVTTEAHARRRGFDDGLAVGESVEVGGLRITAVPARHGPAGTRVVVGPVIGFVLEHPAFTHGAVYFTGDTVDYRALRELPVRVGTLFVHLGAAHYGPLRFTMDAEDGAAFAERLDPHTVIPIHYDDWSHFGDPPEHIVPAFTARGLGDRLRVLEKRVRTAIDV